MSVIIMLPSTYLRQHSVLSMTVVYSVSTSHEDHDQVEAKTPLDSANRTMVRPLHFSQEPDC